MQKNITNPLRNEIYRLLLNINRAKASAVIMEEDSKAFEVFYTINQIAGSKTHPIKFDYKGNGAIKPDIIAYLCPDTRLLEGLQFDSVKDPNFELYSQKFMKLEDDMPVHQIGIEHFIISNYSFKNKNGKMTSKISEFEHQIYEQTKQFGEITIVKDYTQIPIRDKVDLFTSFEYVYQKHYNQKDSYLENIYEINFMGNALNKDRRKLIPIWFLMECDDFFFFDSEANQEVPIFYTKQGFDIMKNIGFVDGYIYYGTHFLYIISTEYLINISESVTAANYSKAEVADKEYLFKDNYLYKNMNSYLKIVR